MALTEEQFADIRSRIPARPETDIPMPYEDLVRKILTEGTLKSDRTGTGTISLFGQQMRFDLSKYFPLLTTKTVFFKGLAYELLWFLKGSSNINWLLEHNVHIWDEWADENGDLGPVYGVQWRSWPAPTPEDPNRTIDQISNVLDLIKHHPDSRRMIVSAWNPAEVEKMALPPCHALFQFYVAPASDDGPARFSCLTVLTQIDRSEGKEYSSRQAALSTWLLTQGKLLQINQYENLDQEMDLFEQAAAFKTRARHVVDELNIPPDTAGSGLFQDFPGRLVLVAVLGGLIGGLAAVIRKKKTPAV